MLAPNALAAESLPKITASRVKILENLRMARFDTLDAELSSYEKKAEQDPRYEMNAIVAFGAFECGNSLIASGVDNWVKAHPDSYAALTAKATCYIFGAQRRIEFWSSKQNDEEAAKFLAEGTRDATEAIKIDQNLAPAYALKIKAARLSGVEQDKARAYYAMHEWQKAVDDAAHSNALYPDNSENLRVLAFAAYRLNNPEASILYLGDLMRFEMPDPETVQLLSSDQALLKSQGKENW
jgi:tetratricopeptide (TPR) repeat protein